MKPFSSQGFSLIELLVVIVIIALLLALSFSWLTRMTETARRAVCTANLCQIGVATYGYASDNNGNLPLPYSGNYPYATDADSIKYQGIVVLLPYFGASTASDAEAENESYVRNFFCPSSTITFSNSWANHAARSCSYAQYCGFATVDGEYVNSPSTIHGNENWITWSDLASDNIPTLTNHRSSNGSPTGSNCLFLDGHVEWKDVSKLTNKISKIGNDYLFFPNN